MTEAPWIIAVDRAGLSGSADLDRHAGFFGLRCLYRPTHVKNRVQQIVDAMVANRAKITAEATALSGATEGYVVQIAEAVEGDALLMAGRI